MTRFEEESFKASIALPAKEQIERAARLIAASRQRPMDNWQEFAEIARDILVISMNQTKIMIGR